MEHTQQPERMFPAKSGDYESQADEAEEWEAPIATPTVVRYCVNHVHVRDLDEECKVDVIWMVVDATHSPEDFDMEDEVEDEAVDSLVRLIDQGHVLNKSMSVTSYSYMRQV
ncbi:hypothetical protein Bca4012_101833 [Brassica carinata]